MIDENTDNQNSQDIQAGSIEDSGGAETSEKIARLKEIGLKGLTPLLNVVHKHKEEINPYFDAIEKALVAGSRSLNQETSSDVDQKVGALLTEGAVLVRDLKSKLASTHTKDLLTSLEEEARKRPGLIFAFSYVAGMVFARVGRHIVKANSGKENFQNINQSDFDPTIH